MAEDQFRLEAGMNVVDTNGNPLGNLESIVSEDATGRSRFLTVASHLLPIETVKGVEGNRVRVDLPREKLDKLPRRTGHDTPTQDEINKAYEIAGVKAQQGQQQRGNR